MLTPKFKDKACNCLFLWPENGQFLKNNLVLNIDWYIYG